MSFSKPVREFDGELNHPENQQLIGYLKRHQPSAHDDLVQLLVESTTELSDIKFYCPDTDNHAYYLAHTPNGIIFAAAIGMSGLMYRLPKQSISGALVKGGEIFKDIEGNWVGFNPFWTNEDDKHQFDMAEMKQWANLAYHNALS